MSKDFNPKDVQLSNFKTVYDEPSLWRTIAKYAKKAGLEVIKNALKLYYAMALGKATPAQITAILGALGYFISPLDVIPDPLPGGLFDDGGILALAVTTIACCANREVVAAAEKKVKEWFD